MLGWIFRKKDAGQQPAAAVPSAPEQVPAAPAVDWALRLSQAQGDDAALLELAGAKAPLDVRQAAIDAIASEAVLKSAERSFRDRDRRTARAARQRHVALAAQREARAQAAELIRNAGVLAGQALIPLNRLADLDRAWQALDPASLEPAQRDEFAAAMQAVSALSRERGDAQLMAERWAGRARDALAALQGVSAEAAAGTRDRAQLAAACQAARDVLAAPTDRRAGPDLAEALSRALSAAGHVDERIAWLEALPATADDPAEAEPRWQALAPLQDASLRDPLEARFSAWRQAVLGAREAARADRAAQARSRQRAVRQEEAAALDAALERAEQALAAGQIEAAEQPLAEAASLASRAGIGEAQRTRAGAAQADHARLKGWQQWGGGVAREELVAEAEALAAGGADAGAQPSSIQSLGESVARLRARWKELDRLGGAGGGALWRRFDDALTAAYQPVAAHAAAQRAARELNLAARLQRLGALEAVALPETPADWKPVAQALDRWRAEWRKLGPLEHTVPGAQREPLLARTSAALSRLELPLEEARRAAQAEREQLIVRARWLADEAASAAPGRDLTGRVRELQAAWQQQSQAMPLARSTEGAAWADFRAAIDAVFSARAAASLARDAALQANAAERAAREAAARHMAEAEHARQRAEAGALRHKLALCAALELADPGFDRTTLAERWSALPALRSDWERALAHRAGLAAGPRATPNPASTDELLLQLEESLGLSSPPELQEARRAIKLQAMKAALEGRGAAAAAGLQAEALITLLLGREGLDSGQHDRLLRALDALPALAAR